MPRDRTVLPSALPRCASAVSPSKSPATCPLLPREPPCSSARSAVSAPPASRCSCRLRPTQSATPQAAQRASSMPPPARSPSRENAHFGVWLKIHRFSWMVSSRYHAQSKNVFFRVHGVKLKYVLLLCSAQTSCHQSVHCFSIARRSQNPLPLPACDPPI